METTRDLIDSSTGLDRVCALYSWGGDISVKCPGDAECNDRTGVSEVVVGARIFGLG